VDRFERLSDRLIQDLDRQPDLLLGDCLPVTLLERYLTGDIDEPSRTRVDAHLERCLVCLNSLVDLRGLLQGLKAPGTVSERLGARLNELMQKPAPLRSRIAEFIPRALAIRIPVGWMLAPVTVAAILTWMILFPGGHGNLPPSPLSSPRTVELSGRPSREAETALQSFRERAQKSTSPQTSPQRPFDVPTLVSETQSAVVLVSSIERSGADVRPRKIGSGFFINPAGLVLTNYHVIKGSTSVSVQLGNGASFVVSTEMIAFANPEKDIAILKVPGRNLPALRLGDSDKIRAGQQVVALGSPLGLESSVSLGVVSGIRQLKEGTFIQTTAPISGGSSGGPLLDMHGEVIGITARSAPEGQNVNFAIPINDVKAVAERPGGVSEADRSVQLYLEGILHFNRQDYAKAEKAFVKATELDPNNFDAWIDLGNVYSAIGEFAKEFVAFQKAVRLRPNNDDARFSLASAYEDKGDFKAAATEYRQAVSLNPKYAEAWFNLAVIQLILGNRAEALESQRKLEPLNRGMALKLQHLLRVTKPGT